MSDCCTGGSRATSILSSGLIVVSTAYTNSSLDDESELDFDEEEEELLLAVDVEDSDESADDDDSLGVSIPGSLSVSVAERTRRRFLPILELVLAPFLTLRVAAAISAKMSKSMLKLKKVST